MLLDGINHIALISKDVAKLGEFYRTVFDATSAPPGATAPAKP